ncbi:HNH endonuclease [Sphingomonas sp. UNC305MFCol5.2]|uniref:HNH endonuclease n=1 Tax=Sphingomonas sp. UNC305MFCol5.2 TaxID=1449076 RepID=UPI00068FFFD9|nr:HNH endonuclease signature motif containing protein [Sphingomonas sp. UNC305MFCol5.2]
MRTFNQLLRGAGIHPAEVSLLRHQTERGGRTPNWLWENDREGFYRYQSTQLDRPVFRNSRYWASFVSPSKHQTLFVGLFECAVRPDVVIDWDDPLGGGPVGDGKDKPYLYYQCTPIPQLSEWIGRLKIEWGNAQRQWTQYAANDDKSIAGGVQRRAPASAPNANSALAKTLSLLGFETRHRTQKLTMLEHAAGMIAYLKNDTTRYPMVIHPWYDAIADRLHSLPGVARDPDRVFYINSNMSAFPVYQDPSRATSSRYGIALEAKDAASLGRLILLLERYRTISTPSGDVIVGAGDNGTTERASYRLARIGQGKFRLDLNQAWNWRCALTGIELQELLRASHIKSWGDSDDGERLDPFNGLLLAAHVDALFDRHLISFSDEGRLLLSARLSETLLRRLAIDPVNARISGLDARHRVYLAHHRARMQLL